MKKITKAILPVAGFGVRFLPATKAQPKTMLPVFDTPVIQKIVEEAVDAGIEEIIIITNHHRRPIEDHFAKNLDLENLLKNRNNLEKLKKIREISQMANFIYLTQNNPKGDGDAILQAKNLLKKDEDVLILFGDDITDSPNKNSIQQILEVYEQTQNPVILLEKIAKKDSHKYGMVGFEEMNDDFLDINKIVEKPTEKESPSDLGIIGKFVLTSEIFNILSDFETKNDELRLTEVLAEFLQNGGQINGKILDGKRFDTGDKIGFLKATLHFALKDENQIVRETLQDFLNEN